MEKISVSCAVSTLIAVLLSTAHASPVKHITPEGLVLMGATNTKEFYITNPEITGDFTHSLSVGCPLRFQMSLAVVDSTEEVAIIDTYFNSTQGNSSDAAWTSAVARVGLIPAHWASSGLRITAFPAPVQGHGPSGAGSSLTYASYNCVTIQRVSVRPPNTPIPGCFPAQSQFNYSPCDVQRRYICEKNI